jgi:hypothetical protein
MNNHRGLLIHSCAVIPGVALNFYRDRDPETTSDCVRAAWIKDPPTLAIMLKIKRMQLLVQ